MSTMGMYDPDSLREATLTQAGRIRELEKQLAAKDALLKSFREDVLFRIGSNSPYRVVAQAYQDKIAAIEKELWK